LLALLIALFCGVLLVLFIFTKGRKKIGFKFKKGMHTTRSTPRKKRSLFKNPKPASTPANKTVIKYEPILYVMQYAKMKIGKPSRKLTAQSQVKLNDERQIVKDDKQQEMLSEQNNIIQNFNLAQNEIPKLKNYTLKIQPAELTIKIRNYLMNFARLNPMLLDAFIDEANRTFTRNVKQVTGALKKDLTHYSANLRVAYDVFSTLEELDVAIQDANKEASDHTLKGAHRDVIEAVNVKIGELHESRREIKENYAETLNTQHSVGKQIVYHIRNRINISIDELETLKSFYCSICQIIGKSPPDKFVFNRNKEEAALIKAIFEDEVMEVMKKFGTTLREDGTFGVSIIDLGGEKDVSNSKEKSEADSCADS
jgi:hypothetical protein